MKAIMSVLITLAALSVAGADWSIGYDFKYDYETVYSNLMEREHRDGQELDDWIERGSATVTSSPVFKDGIRLTGWSTGYYDERTGDFDFGLASAIYRFYVPRGTQYLKVKVSYRGEGGRTEFDDTDEIAGRVWVRNFNRERLQRRSDDDETLYGDTFLLRASRRMETISFPAAEHVDNGEVEIHVVVNDGMMLDLDYIVLESYRRMPEIKVVNRYYRVYDDHPWYHYTYVYFYDGPAYYITDYGYYVRWVYPSYDRTFLRIRLTVGDHLSFYHATHPRDFWYRRWSDIYYVDRDVYYVDKDVYVIHRARVRPWTDDDDRVRREFTVVKRAPNQERSRIAAVRNRVQETISRHRSQVVDITRSSVQPTTVRRTRPTDSRSNSTYSSLQPGTTRERTNVITPRTEIRIRNRSEEESRTKVTNPPEQSSRRSSVSSRVQEHRREEKPDNSRIRDSGSSRVRTPEPSEKSKDDEDDEDDEDKKDNQSRRDSIRSRIRR